MAQRIIVLSDGTGNAASKVWRTNVWRIFESLSLTGSDQAARYDDGVGTSSFLPLAILGGAFGWGLKRNILDLYKFICRNYQPGAQIYAFGFSRGAFTVRVLIAFVLYQGLVPYTTETELDSRAKDAYRAYRSERYHSILRIEWFFRKLRDAYIFVRDLLTGHQPYDRSANQPVPFIEFMGVWDTVAAYGLPIDEMTRGVSQWIWPLELPGRVLDPRVRRACHAVALDDERTTFHPVLWNEAGESEAPPDKDGVRWIKDERLTQVWFAGVHSNVGGGYPDDSLAFLPLYWIMEQAAQRGLILKRAPWADPDALLRTVSGRDKDGRLYDSRAGTGGYYRYGPRKIADLCHMRFSSREGDAVDIKMPKIHESALTRMRSDSNAYAPIGLPEEYAVVTDNGRILQGNSNPYETPAEAKARVKQQEKIWNLVWVRRIVYFLTLAASFHLAAFWLFHGLNTEREYSSPVRLVSESVRLVESFLPHLVVHWWTDRFAENPVSFAIGIVALVILISFGSSLGARITDAMRIVWVTKGRQAVIPDSLVHAAIFRLRTHPLYQAVLMGMKRHVMPLASVIVLVWVGLGFASHTLFNIADSTGAFCHASAQSGLKKLEKQGQRSDPVVFATDKLCLPTGIAVEKGVRYAITVVLLSPWKHRTVETNPNGFMSDEANSWTQAVAMYSAVPLRRVIFRPWFRLLARIGAKGVDEYFLDLKEVEGQRNTFRAVIERAQRGGEVFLYVNDAVLPLPWVNDVFYTNNHGQAKIILERLS